MELGNIFRFLEIVEGALGFFLIKFVVTEIIISAFEKCGGEIPGEKVSEQREVFFHELFLERDARGHEEDSFSSLCCVVNRRYRVADTFARTGWSLDQEVLFVTNSFVHCLGQFELAGAWNVVFEVS